MRWSTAPLAVLVFAVGVVGAGAEVRGAPSLAIFGVPAVLKITPAEPPGPTWRTGLAVAECARNEWESIQFVVRASEAVAGLRVRMSELRSPQGGVLPAGRVRLRRVERVDLNASSETGQPAETADFQPDPLVPLKPEADRFSLEAGRNLVFWAMVGVPDSAAAGVYEGDFTVSADRAAPVVLRVRVRVRDFTLPRRPLLQSLVGLEVPNLYKAHGCKTAAQREAVVRLYLEEYIRARLSPFLYAPSTAAFSPLPGGLITWEFIKGPDGAPSGGVKMDFAGFDREAERYLDQRQAFAAFNIAPYLWRWRGEGSKREIVLQIRDSRDTVVERLNADGSHNPLFDSLVVTVFRQIATHLDNKKWLDRALYYVADEPAEQDVPGLKQICRLVRQADPRLRTALTLDPASRPGLAGLVDGAGRSLISVWIPHWTAYRDDVAVGQRAKGAEYWLYDVRDASLISQTGTTNRAMLWTVWRNAATGYLYYSSTYWGRDDTPWERPSFVIPDVAYHYRYGDGFFFYPPTRRYQPETPVLDTTVTTIRWELLREGAEDYDTLRLLEGLTEEAERRGLAVAKSGREALAQARKLAASMAAGPVGGGVADLDFGARDRSLRVIPGTSWTFDDREGWLRHRGGRRADLNISFPAEVPDGRYELIVTAFSGNGSPSRSYSRFLIDGRPLSTRTSAFEGPVEVKAGEVDVRNGACRFTLSSVEENAGVILYKVAIKLPESDSSAGLYAMRSRLADAIEHLQQMLEKQP